MCVPLVEVGKVVTGEFVCCANQLFTGSSLRLSLRIPETNPPANEAGCWVNSLNNGSSSSRNIFLSPIGEKG